MTAKKYTDEQLQAAYLEHGSYRKAAKALGMNCRGLERRFADMKRRGWSPEYDLTHIVPDGFRLKGTSTLYDEAGKPKLQWVKSQVDHERQAEIMEAAIQAMADDLPRVVAMAQPRGVSDDLMAVYPLGDPHIGLLAWAPETGEDWDLKIAEDKMCRVFDRLVKSAPKCEKAAIVNLGDLFHSENMEGITNASGHHLDTDGRYAKMIRVGVKIIRQMIQSALEHHGKVAVINAPGNHDTTASLFLSICLANIYENEPRVKVDTSPAPFHYIRHGSVLIGVHHGHSCKADRLMGVMASDRSKDWGETRHRYWLTGHIHHDTKKEYAGCTVESFRTLAAKDAYATWGGYRSGQDSKCLVMHKDHGEVERHTANIGMV